MNMINMRESASLDRSREEMMWNAKTEAKIIEWKKEAEQASNLHEARGYRLKRYHKMLGLLAIITPIIFAIAIQLVYENDRLKNIVSTIGLGMSSISTAVFGFLRLEIRKQQNFDYQAKYLEYAMHLGSELVKPKAHRIQCDVFLKESELCLIFINQNAPT
jgi:hypothetical protein